MLSPTSSMLVLLALASSTSLSQAQFNVSDTFCCSTFTPIHNYTQPGYSHRISAALSCTDALAMGPNKTCPLSVNHNGTELVEILFSLEDAITDATTKNYSYYGASLGNVTNGTANIVVGSTAYVFFTNLMQCFLGSVSGCNGTFISNDTVIASCAPVRRNIMTDEQDNIWEGTITYGFFDNASEAANLTTNPAAEVIGSSATTLANFSSVPANNLNLSGLFGYGGWDNETTFSDGRVPKLGAAGVGLVSNSSNSSGTNSSGGSNSSGSGTTSAAVRTSDLTMGTTILGLSAMMALTL